MAPLCHGRAPHPSTFLPKHRALLVTQNSSLQTGANITSCPSSLFPKAWHRPSKRCGSGGSERDPPGGPTVTAPPLHAGSVGSVPARRTKVLRAAWSGPGREKREKENIPFRQEQDSVALVPKFHSCLPDTLLIVPHSGAVETDRLGLKSKSQPLPAA